MNKKHKMIGMLVLALLLGGATFFLTQTYLKDREAEILNANRPVAENTVKVIVAVGNINKGDVLQGSMVAPVEYPAEFVSEGAISPNVAANYFGQVSNVPIKRGQILYSSNLGGRVVDRFSDLLKDGGTAVTLEVDDKKSNSHMLIPGDYVDILVLADKSKVEPTTLVDLAKRKSQGKSKMLVPLLAKIKVLSVDRNPLLAKDEEFRVPRNAQGEVKSYSNVTVGVPINDATKLALAQDLGEIVFFLRNSGDERKVKVRTLDGLFGTFDSEGRLRSRYEYYSSTARQLLTPVSKKIEKKHKEFGEDKGVDENSNKSLVSRKSPAIIFENNAQKIENSVDRPSSRMKVVGPTKSRNPGQSATN